MPSREFAASSRGTGTGAQSVFRAGGWGTRLPVKVVGVLRQYGVPCRDRIKQGRVYTVSDSGIIGQAYGRKIHVREVVAIDEAGDGLCWVRLTRFGDDWLLIRSDARDVSRAVRKLRQIPAGEQSDRFPEVGA